MLEREMQQSMFDEIDLRANQDVRWRLIAAVPNGQYRKGQRMEPGLRPGFPDIIVPVPRAATKKHPAYCGMVMELKVGRNKPDGQQEWWLAMLREQGWYTCWVKDDPANGIWLINWYLEGKDE